MNGHDRDAIKTWKKVEPWIPLEITHAEAWIHLGFLHDKLNKHGQANYFYSRVKRDHPQYIHMIDFYKGYVCELREEWEEAVNHFIHSLEHIPDPLPQFLISPVAPSFMIYSRLGWIYLEKLLGLIQ